MKFLVAWTTCEPKFVPITTCHVGLRPSGGQRVPMCVVCNWRAGGAQLEGVEGGAAAAAVAAAASAASGSDEV